MKILFTFVFLLSINGARADDSSLGVPLPGLQSDPPGIAKASSALISLEDGNIRLKLNIVFSSEKRTQLFVTTPRFGWLGEGEFYPDRQFPELKFLIDDKPVKEDSRSSEFFGKTEVTEDVTSAGLNPFTIVETPPFVAGTTNHMEAFSKLVRLGAVEKSDHDSFLAKWEAQRRVSVYINPAIQKNVTLLYKARPKSALVKINEIKAEPYCLDAEKLAKILKHPKSKDLFIANEFAIAASIDNDRNTVTHLQVSGKTNNRRPTFAFCDKNGQSIVENSAEFKSSVRLDANGIVHVLTLSQP